jgi:GT2 family glycosyltransferase
MKRVSDAPCCASSPLLKKANRSQPEQAQLLLSITPPKELSGYEMNVCAVVVTYNRKHMLENCLRTLLSGDVVPVNILVVDNASTDGTVEFVQKTFPKGVSVLSLQQNRGGAGGFKAGLTEALRSDYEYFWMMDDDHEVAPDALKILLATMQQQSCDVAGPAILSSARDGSLSWEIGLQCRPVSPVSVREVGIA